LFLEFLEFDDCDLLGVAVFLVGHAPY
jgi:hypothetical protein